MLRLLPGRARVRIESLKRTLGDLRDLAAGRGQPVGPLLTITPRPAPGAGTRGTAPTRRRSQRQRVTPSRAAAPAAAVESAAVAPAATATPTTAHAVTFADDERTLMVREDQTVLEAALEAGIALEFSCAVGGCAACRRRLRSGEIEMEYPNCLTEEEHAEGYRLLCVGRPRSALVFEGADA